MKDIFRYVHFLILIEKNFFLKSKNTHRSTLFFLFTLVKLFSVIITDSVFLFSYVEEAIFSDAFKFSYSFIRVQKLFIYIFVVFKKEKKNEEN